MQRRPFGNSGLDVSVLGFGAGHIGSPQMTEDQAAHLLNTALDLGINLIDTARGYGLSEERIGRHIAHRRGEYILATKCGYGIPGHEDWTPGCITAGVDEALRRLRTDHIDIMFLHSCPRWTLERHGVAEALGRAVEAGKVRFAGYSGENEDLDHALAMKSFRAIETSANLFDQRGLSRGIRTARLAGLGVIAKRPLGNAPWRFAECPTGDYCETYWHRMQAMQPDRRSLPWDEYALRFACYQPGVSTAIVGTSRVENLRRNIDAVAKGPLPADHVDETRDAFVASHHWTGQV